MRLDIRARAVLDAAGDDVQLAGAQLDLAVAQLDHQAAAEHEEEVVGVLVAVPHELAQHLDDRDLVVVEVRDDARVKRRVEQRELLGEVDIASIGDPCRRRPGPSTIASHGGSAARPDSGTSDRERVGLATAGGGDVERGLHQAPGGEHVVAREAAGAVGAAGGERVADRAVLHVVAGEELVELAARAPARGRR